jgi:hypothetical protein
MPQPGLNFWFEGGGYVACPAIDDLDRFFDLGYRQGQKFLSELPANRFTV